MRVVFVLSMLLSSLLARPASYASSDIECDENSHLGPTPPDAYACAEGRDPNPALDCYRVGLFLPVVQEQELDYQCEP